jgi:hypothetical protein
MAQSSVDASLTSTDILLLCGVDIDDEPPAPLLPPLPPHPASTAEIAPANNSLDEFAFMVSPPKKLEFQLFRRREAVVASHAIDSHNGAASIALTNGFPCTHECCVRASRGWRKMATVDGE